MLVERIQELTANFNEPFDEGQELYHFKYGKEHWQNLGDYPNDEMEPFVARHKHILLLWQDRQHRLNEYGALIGYTFTGEFLFLVRSKISDSDYEYKYETHIKNLQGESERMLDDFNICEEWTVTNWKEIEVENLFDTNMDGLKIQFTLMFDEA